MNYQSDSLATHVSEPLVKFHRAACFSLQRRLCASPVMRTSDFSLAWHDDVSGDGEVQQFHEDPRPSLIALKLRSDHVLEPLRRLPCNA